jgi:predicted metallo-beta-lactamase superfamily hydrolase
MKALDVLYDTYKSGSVLQTAAEFLGRNTIPLEALRKRLFTAAPPSCEFEKWMKADDETKKHTKPPI